MTIVVRLHPAILEKYGCWRDTFPGTPADVTRLLNVCFEDFGKRAVDYAARHRLGLTPFQFEGPASQWFLISVSRPDRNTRQVLILDLVDSPEAPASR